MKKLNVDDKLFAYIPSYGVHEFQVHSITDVGNSLSHVIIGGYNKFTDCDVVLLCLFDGQKIEFIKLLSHRSDHWYRLGEFEIFTNPLKAYSVACKREVQYLKGVLREYGQESKRKIEDMKEKIKEVEEGVENTQFLLNFSKGRGLRDESFQIHAYLNKEED